MSNHTMYMYPGSLRCAFPAFLFLFCSLSARLVLGTDQISFFAHGDWGKGGYNGTYSRRLEGGGGRGLHEEETFMQGAVADAMNAVASDSKPSFVLALGECDYSSITLDDYFSI